MYTRRSDLDVYVDVKGHFCCAGVLSAYRDDDAGTDLLRVAAAACAADHGDAGYADRTSLLIKQSSSIPEKEIMEKVQYAS